MSGPLIPQAPKRRTMRQAVRLYMLQAAGTFYRRPGPSETPRSVLLIRPDHLGDMLFLTPGLHALRLALPASRITLLAGPWSTAIVRGNTDLDDVRICRFPAFERSRAGRRPGWQPYGLLLDTARQLKQESYDAAVVLRFDHWWGAWLAAIAGIPRRIGYDWPETRPFLTEALPYETERHEVEQDAALLRALAPGAAWDLGPTRYVMTEEDQAWAVEWLAARGVDDVRPLVAIHPGAGARVKQWPPQAWAAVADELAKRFDAQILLTGSPDEQPLAQQLAGAATWPVIDAAGATSLGQLAALQQQCDLVLGSDCGPLHLAVAVGVPTVHLYGPVAPAKFGPWGNPLRNQVLLGHWPCVPCNRLDWPDSVLAQHRCVESITPEEVCGAAASVLARIGMSA